MVTVHNSIKPLSNKEKQWLLERRVARITDDKEVQIYPMGAERYLASSLPKLADLIINKNVLVLPGHGNNGFLLAQAGAQSVTVFDKDPVTLAWIRAFKIFYHFREQAVFPSVGELLTALTCWYPPVLCLPSGKYRNKLLWMLAPNELRRVYLHYLITLIQKALQSNLDNHFELDKAIHFYTGTIEEIIAQQVLFETAYIPYLLGVTNGVEKKEDIVQLVKQLLQLSPKAYIIVTPTRNTKEFFLFGKRYFVTTDYKNIQAIPELKPYLRKEDNQWFRRQGIVIFGSD